MIAIGSAAIAQCAAGDVGVVKWATVAVQSGEVTHEWSVAPVLFVSTPAHLRTHMCAHTAMGEKHIHLRHIQCIPAEATPSETQVLPLSSLSLLNAPLNSDRSVCCLRALCASSAAIRSFNFR